MSDSPLYLDSFEIEPIGRRLCGLCGEVDARRATSTVSFVHLVLDSGHGVVSEVHCCEEHSKELADKLARSMVESSRLEHQLAEARRENERLQEFAADKERLDFAEIWVTHEVMTNRLHLDLDMPRDKPTGKGFLRDAIDQWRAECEDDAGEEPQP